MNTAPQELETYNHATFQARPESQKDRKKARFFSSSPRWSIGGGFFTYNSAFMCWWKICTYLFAFCLTIAAMSCWVHAELENEWKKLIEQGIGQHSSGYDSATVRLYWQMIEHRKTCEVCRDEETVRNMDAILGKSR